MKTTQNIPIPEETINAVRSLLMKQGAAEADVPQFVDQVLRRELLHRTVAEIKQQNAGVDPDKLQQEIDEAVGWARFLTPKALYNKAPGRAAHPGL